MQITHENYLDNFLEFQDRQSGVGLVFNPESDAYTYNVYCIDRKLMKEIYSAEVEFLDDALSLLNDEFATWKLVSYDSESGCSTCANKSHS